MTSRYYTMTDSTGNSGFLPTVVFVGSSTGFFTSAHRINSLNMIGIKGYYEADFSNTVTTIDLSAFAFDTSLVVATINGVRSIRSDAFYGCTALRSITLDCSVNASKNYLLTDISSGAFRGCTSLRNLHIPDTVKIIPDNMCNGCTSLEVAVMGYGCDRAGDTYNRLGTIGEYAFANCSKLSYFVIPETVKNVYDYAFANDVSLSLVYILGRPDVSANSFTGARSTGATYYYDMSKNNLTSFATDISSAIPGSATRRIYREFTLTATGELTPTTVRNTIPATTYWKGKIAASVNTLAQSCFAGASAGADIKYPYMVALSLPPALTSIGYGAFINTDGTSGYSCIVGAFYIPNSVTTLGTIYNTSNTFAGFTEALRDTSTTKQIVFQSGPNTIAFPAFTCKVSSAMAIILPNVTSFGQECFNYAKNVQLYSFFQKNAYTSATRLDDVTADAGANAFTWNFNKGVAGYTHYLYIPKQITRIAVNAFRGLRDKIYVTAYHNYGLSTDVAGLGFGFFSYDATDTNNARFTGTAPTMHLIYNYYDVAGTTLSTSSAIGTGFPYHVLFPSGVTAITNRFGGSTTLKSIAVHHSASQTVDINNWAFYNCTDLSYVYFNNRVLTVGVNAFRNAPLSNSFDLSDASPLMGIYHAAFFTDTGYKSLIQQITIPNSVKALGTYVFGAAAGTKSSFTTLSFADGIEFWGEHDTTNGANRFTDTNTASAKYMAIPAYFCTACDALTSVSFLDTVDSSGNAIPTYSSGLMYYPDINSPMPTRINKQILTTYKIKRIGEYAFNACRRLQSVRVPDGVTTILTGSFFDLYSCSYLYLPDSLTTITTATLGYEAFTWMNLTNQYDNTVNNPNASKSCIRFPSAFLSNIRGTSMNSPMFGVATADNNLRYITVDVSSTYSAISNGVLGRFMNNNITSMYFNVIIPSNVVSLLPDKNETQSTFGTHNISSITLPSTLVNIPQSSCFGCSPLKNVFIPTNSNLSYIGSSAFQNCSALTSFFIPNSLHRINSNTFYGCTSLASITYGDNPGIISIDDYAFYNTTRALTSLFIPASVVNIGRFAFIGNGGTNILNTVTIGAGSRLKAIGGYAFGDTTYTNAATPLYNLVLPSTLRYMGGNKNTDNGQIFRNAFRSNHTDNFVFPSSLSFIPTGCFYIDTANGSIVDISNVYIPMSITATAGPRIHNGYRDNTRSVGGVGGYIFNQSKSGSLLYLPSHLSSVTATSGDSDGTADVNSFPNRTGTSRTRSYYRSVSYSTNPLISLDLSSAVATTVDTTTTQYHAAISEGVITIGDGTNTIARNTAGAGGASNANVANLISVNIPSTVTTIRDHAFKGSSALVYVTFSENSHLTSIGTSSFQDCSMIHDIRLPDTLTTIGPNAFYGCTNLSTISIPYNVTSLGSGAFSTTPSNTTFTKIGSNMIGSASTEFGTSVSLGSDGKIIAIGAPKYNSNMGRVQVFIFNAGSSSWTQLGSDLVGTTTNSFFGYSVSLSSDGLTLACGAPNYNSYAGLVRVYRYNSTSSSWIQLGSDFTGSTNDTVGYSVSLSSDGNTLAFGAPNFNGGIVGYVKVFRYTSSWGQLGSNIPAYNTFNVQYGYSISLSGNGNRIAIGDPKYDSNSGFFIVFSYSGSSWSLFGTPTAGNALNQLGCSVSLSYDGNTLAVGSYGYNSNAGLVSIFRYATTNWATMSGGSITGPASSRFGISVSLSSDGNTIAIGGHMNSSNAGLVRIYRYASSSWGQLGSNITGTAGDYLGYSVSLSSNGNTFAAGAYGYSNNTGYAQVFSRIAQLKSVQLHQRLYTDISSSLSTYFSYSPAINFQIIPSLTLTNTLNPAKLTISQINNLYIRQRQSQLTGCTMVTVSASSGGILTFADVTNALSGTTGLVHLDISTNVTSINGEVCLNNSRIYSVAISKTVVTFGTSVFNGCQNLAYLSFHPDSVCTTIGDSAFFGTNIFDLALPDSLTTILANAFRSSFNLTSVCIPKNVTTLGFYAFYACPKLTSVVLPTSLSAFNTGTYFSTSGTTPPGTFTTYSTSAAIPHFKLSDYSLPSGIVQTVVDSAVKYIDHRAYYYYPDIALYSVSNFNQIVSSGPFSYQVNNIEMPVQPAALMLNAATVNNSSRYPIYRSIPDLNVYTSVNSTFTIAMDNIDDFWVLYPGYSMSVYYNLYDEENLPVYTPSIANITTDTSSAEIATYWDNEFGTTPLTIDTNNNVASSVLIMYNGKIVSKVYIK